MFLTREWTPSPNVANLIRLFVVWKALLVAIVCICPSDGYDSSTNTLLRSYSRKISAGIPAAALPSPRFPLLAGFLTRLVNRLTRWDAIYFTSVSAKGSYVHENEWAFSWGYTALLKWVGAFVHLENNAVANAAIHGIILSTISHLASAITLFHLVLALSQSSSFDRSRRLAFITAALHVLSPAGAFLVAPFSEALFAACSFLGVFLYTRAFLGLGKDAPDFSLWMCNLLVLGSGVCFGVATLVRSNGLFYGLIFAYDVAVWLTSYTSRILSNQWFWALILPALVLVANLLTTWFKPTLLGISELIAHADLPINFDTAALKDTHFKIRPSDSFIAAGIMGVIYITLVFISKVEVQQKSSIWATVFAGIAVAAGFIYPQYMAFLEYCRSNESSGIPWCNQLPPSIYTSIQDRYWNVGPFRYWTVSNLPLFVIAAPMLLVLTYSAATTFYVNSQHIDAILASIRTPHRATVPQETPSITISTKAVLRRLALPQIVLAVLAFTSFHVQVINRLSSGYVLWYLYIARSVLQGDRYAVWAVRLMIMYAMVQASLFAAFLPPA